MTVAGVARAIGGARLVASIPHRALARGFAVPVVAVAGCVPLSVALLGGPPSAN